VDEPVPIKRDPLTVWPDSTPKILAHLTTIGFFGALAGLYVVPIPPENKEAILLLLGSVGTAWVAIIMYFYGTSAGSESRSAVRTNAEASKGKEHV
jgi:hypothetical protein